MKGKKMPELKTAATRIHYQLEGPADGPVVMLAHSLGVTLSMWDPQVPALTAAGYRVLRYDHRGHGRSDVPPGPYSIAQMGRDVIDLLDGLAMEKVHFCGLSLGGMVGQELGVRHGRRLHSLILCSTSAHMPPREIWEERIQSVRENGMGVVIDATIDRWFTPADQARLPGKVQKIRNALSAMSVEGFCACCAAIRDMVGQHDQGTPVAAARFIHERIAPSRLVVIADAAHLQNVTQTDVFTKTMLEFLEEDA
jgi:3-oxoadipate enol-lactonase